MESVQLLATTYRPGIPGAPIDAAVNPTAQAIFTAICLVPAVICIGLAIKSLVKDRDTLWPIFLVGGTIGMFVEPILDYMGGVWWPVHGDWEAFRLLDVNIPVLVCFVYPWLLGGQAYYSYRSFQRGITVRKLWMLVGIFALNDIVLETIGIRLLNVYSYFGTQPLNPWGLPLWYVPCNAVGPVVAAALFYVLRDQLRGWRVLAGVWLFPMSFVGVYAASGWPMWVSLNSEFGMLAATIASVLVFVQAALIVMVVAKMVGAVPSTATSSPGSPPSVASADSPASPGGGIASGSR
ncbi:hypothetical protein MycrhDRAFT_1206 [Mycolicibacterium rhodesiae JS60]|nr:hypothetical protein MycrhDRAFT_1206 [Mycolicibacterium rhodesiae JS60]